jgi:hypothetical protein
MNRLSIAGPRSRSHALQFMAMNERRALAPGDIILLFGPLETHPTLRQKPADGTPPKRTELIMAISVYHAKEVVSFSYRLSWQKIMAMMHNELLDLWYSISKVDATHAFMMSLDYSQIPVSIPSTAPVARGANYLNSILSVFDAAPAPASAAADQQVASNAQPLGTISGLGTSLTADVQAAAAAIPQATAVVTAASIASTPSSSFTFAAPSPGFPFGGSPFPSSAACAVQMTGFKFGGPAPPRAAVNTTEHIGFASIAARISTANSGGGGGGGGGGRSSEKAAKKPKTAQ